MMEILGAFIVLVIGLALGSFITCITYRFSEGLTFLKGRSFCPNCKAQISWYDNIPVASFIVLRGKCRHCKKPISLRYPAIELTTAVLFLLFYFLYLNCNIGQYYFCSWTGSFSLLALPFLLFILVVVISIFVTDLEHQIIPDELVFTGMTLALLFFLISDSSVYLRLLSAFTGSSFLLILHLITRGKGMGLGDVKFAVFAGMLLNPINMIEWLFLSFMIGALVGSILILSNKAKFGTRIAFGPFLALSLVIILIFGGKILPL